MKVLIVEDNPVNAEMIRITLEKEQYEVVLAHDGEDALAKIEEHADVDLLVTDVMMPNVTGLELLERIRQRPEWQTLPVVVATSMANQATVRQAVSLHCKHFIVKPFTVQLLLQAVREAIAQRGVVLHEKPRVLGRLGLDGDGYDRLALSFSEFVRDRVTALRELAEREQHDAPDVPMQRDLFALEESAALLGAERLGHLLAALGLPGETPPTEKLRGAYRALLIELEKLASVLPPPPKKSKKIVGDEGEEPPAEASPDPTS